MLLKAFSIYDVKAENYNPPFFVHTVGIAIRHFQELANDEQTMICKYPEDYTLYDIGTFDDSCGILKPHANTVPIGKALEFKHQDQAEKWLPPETSESKDHSKSNSAK